MYYSKKYITRGPLKILLLASDALTPFCHFLEGSFMSVFSCSVMTRFSAEPQPRVTRTWDPTSTLSSQLLGLWQTLFFPGLCVFWVWRSIFLFPLFCWAAVWKWSVWSTVILSTGTGRCITPGRRHLLKPARPRSTKSWARLSTFSLTKQAPSLRTSWLSKSAPSMGRYMVRDPVPPPPWYCGCSLHHSQTTAPLLALSFFHL